MPYDTQWPVLFDAERVRLEAVLRDWLVGGFHHVGSTAVPGLPAKPVIDMVAGVGDMSDAGLAEPALVGLGYERAFIVSTRSCSTRQLAASTRVTST